MTILLFGLDLAALCLLWFSGRSGRGSRVLLAAALLLAVLISAHIDGWRWPLVPLWLLSLGLGWGLVVGKRPAPAGQGQWPSRLAFALVLALLYCALNLGLLAVSGLGLPKLDGPYPVAKHQWTIRSQRPDIESSDPFAKREFLVNVYYPTLVNNEMRHAPYLSDAMLHARFLERRSPFERFFFRSEIGRIQSQAWHRWGSALSPVQGKYPVVIFSPGGGWFADMHSFFLEQLASHGYAVFAITHPGGTNLVEYPDGRRSRWGWSNHALVEDRVTSDRREAELGKRWIELEGRAREGRLPNEGELRQLMSLVSEPLLTDPLTVRKEDMIELLDRLEGLNAGVPASQFAGRLDMENVAVTGMSYGGATASEVCLDDDRCKVVINMDGTEYGRLPFEGNTIPALWLSRQVEGRVFGMDMLRQLAYDRYEGPAYRVEFEGAEHGTFADFPFWPPGFDWRGILIPQWSRSEDDRSIPPLILAYALDFLGHHLKGKELRLLCGSHAEAGVAVECKHGPAKPRVPAS